MVIPNFIPKIICLDNLKILFKTYDILLIESFIGGQEVQVAVINGKPLGAIELKPKRKFYDIKLNILKQQKQNISH